MKQMIVCPPKAGIVHIGLPGVGCGCRMRLHGYTRYVGSASLR